MGTPLHLHTSVTLVFFKGYWVGEDPEKCVPPSTNFVPCKLLGTIIKDKINRHRNTYDTPYILMKFSGRTSIIYL